MKEDRAQAEKINKLLQSWVGESVKIGSIALGEVSAAKYDADEGVLSWTWTPWPIERILAEGDA